jgi:hypothetical protein
VCSASGRLHTTSSLPRVSSDLGGPESLSPPAPEGRIYRLLVEHVAALFGEEYFADLFKRSTFGRPTVPARVVATVMLLQAYEGLSDREACDRLAFDLGGRPPPG